MKTPSSLLLVVCGLSACSFYARGPDDYRAAVRTILDSKRPDVEACYKREYESNPVAQGRVVAKFTVEAKSGKITKPEIVDEGTTAAEGLKQCVLRSLEGLTLAPPDQRTGDATFIWEFSR